MELSANSGFCRPLVKPLRGVGVLYFKMFSGRGQIFPEFQTIDSSQGLGMVFKTPVKPGWRERRREGTMAA